MNLIEILYIMTLIGLLVLRFIVKIYFKKKIDACDAEIEYYEKKLKEINQTIDDDVDTNRTEGGTRVLR